MNVLVINGPNLNMLGIREPEVYGKNSYEALCQFISDEAQKRAITVKIYQSNIEGEIINEIQAALGKFDGIVINAGAYTHYSFAILDALKAVDIPAVEVHLSDVSKREVFRQVSVIRDACIDCIMGKGFDSYKEALDVLVKNHNK